jgi:hypothetical protein
MRSASIIILVLSIAGCATSNKGGAIPMYFDEFIFTTEDRYFELSNELFGTVLDYQAAYPCIYDSIIYNSTTVVELETGDTITVYTPCCQDEIPYGSKVIVSPISYNHEYRWTKREINKPFPKKSENYPYWECISCKYKNTIGKVTFANIR